MNISAFNPELVRNTPDSSASRSRIAVVITICAVISLTAAASYYLGGPGGRRVPEDAQNLADDDSLPFKSWPCLWAAEYIQLLSIHREKDLNTFDFQRITRRTPFELVLGKLFGAPIQMYFAFLCLAPVTIWAAYLGARCKLPWW